MRDIQLVAICTWPYKLHHLYQVLPFFAFFFFWTPNSYKVVFSTLHNKCTKGVPKNVSESESNILTYVCEPVWHYLILSRCPNSTHPAFQTGQNKFPFSFFFLLIVQNPALKSIDCLCAYLQYRWQWSVPVRPMLLCLWVNDKWLGKQQAR